MKKQIIFLTGLLFFVFSGIKAQNPFNMQTFAIPLHLNPAFTGLQQNPGLGLQHFYEPLISSDPAKRIRTRTLKTKLSYDQQISENAGNAGLILGYSSFRDGRFSDASVGGLYSYNFELKKNLFLSAGINMSLHINSLNYDKLWEQTRFPPPQPLPQGIERKYFVNINPGILLHNEKFFGGITVYNLTNENPVFQFNHHLGNYRNFNIHAGTFINLSENFRKGWMLNPYALYDNNIPKEGRAVTIGLNASKEIITFGARFSHLPDIFLIDANIGFNTGRFKFGYSNILLGEDTYMGMNNLLTFYYYFTKPRETNENKLVNNYRRIF